MFKTCFLKLKHSYDDIIAKTYSYFLFNSSWTLILTYAIFSVLLSLGLVQLKMNTNDPESLTYVRNSEALNNYHRLDNTFVFNQYERNFANKQLYIAYYVEIIVCARMPNSTWRQSNNDLFKPEFNLLNRTYLEEFNELYDSISSLEIEDDQDEEEEEKETTNSNSTTNISLNKTSDTIINIMNVINQTNSSNSTTLLKNRRRKSYRYESDLCAKRFGKCATEGGLARSPIFQEKLLKHMVHYDDDDPKMSYADTEVLDGISFMVLFGKYRKEFKRAQSNYVTHTGVLRVRFDLLSTTQREKRQAIKFMKKFVVHMDKIERENKLKHLNVSYHASHLLNDEIQKYSTQDVKFVLLAMLVFLTIMSLTMWFGLNSTKFFRRLPQPETIFVDGAGYLPIAIIAKFILTTTSTFGLTSLLNWDLNPLVFTIVFVFLINGCHQSFVLYANAQTWLRSMRSRKSAEKLAAEEAAVMSQLSDKKLDLDTFVTRLAQKLIVPSTFGLFALLLSYIVIGLTSSFDSVRDFAFYTAIGCLLDHFGQVTFFMPCLYLNLKRAVKRQNCMCFCLKGDEENPVNENNNNETVKSEFSIDDENVNKIKRPASLPSSSSSSSSSLSNRWRTWLKSKKFTYFLAFLALVYALFNIAVCVLKFRVGLPVYEIIPRESYSRKHMSNHLQLFDLAPIVNVAFMTPRPYWNATEYNRIREFINDAKLIKGMDRRFEWNWLQAVHDHSQMSAELSDNPHCEKDHFNLECFKSAFMDAAAQYFMFEDDVVYEHNESKPFEIRSSRVYLHYKHFFGDLHEADTNEKLNHLAQSKYGFARGEVVFYSIIDVFFEQMRELPSHYLSITVLTIEALILFSFLIVVDLKTILLLALVLISFALSVFAGMILLAEKLNFVLLMHFMLVPGLTAEFFFSTPYLYLSSAAAAVKKKPPKTRRTKLDASNEDLREPSPPLVNSSSSSTSNEPMKPRIRRRKQIRFSYTQFTKHSAYFLLFVVLFSFLLTNFVTTYAFSMLYKLLLVTTFNLALHLAVIFPLLLSLFGSVWV